MDIDTDGPLSEDEIQVLDDFLMSPTVPDDCMDLSMLDGFLTALAIGPSTVPPSQWLPEIWGGEMAWASEAQARRITTLVFRHANALLFFLRDEPDSFEPLLWEVEQDGEPVVILDEWCTGFVRGMFLDDDAWQPLLDTEEGEEMLYPILLYGTEGGWDELRNNPELAARHAEFATLLGESVAAIQDWWRPRRKAAAAVRRDESKVGRNDLCPCGSGKKFKKCCGAPERLH